MATLYARIPDALYAKLSEDARLRGLNITTTTILLLEDALDRAKKSRNTVTNRGARYRDEQAS